MKEKKNKIGTKGEKVQEQLSGTRIFPDPDEFYYGIFQGWGGGGCVRFTGGYWGKGTV